METFFSQIGTFVIKGTASNLCGAQSEMISSSNVPPKRIFITLG